MLEFQILLPLCLGVLLIVTTVRHQAFLNPISMISVWWLFWLWVSNFSLIGLDIPSRKTQLLTILMIVSMNVGSWLYRPVRISKPDVSHQDVQTFLKAKRLFAVVYAIAFVPVAWFLTKALVLMNQIGAEAFKDQAFWTPTQAGLLFPSPTVQSLYFVLTGPLIFLLGLIGIGADLFYGRFSLLLLSLFLVRILA